MKKEYILITGSARRIGRRLALDTARSGKNVIIHHGHSDADAESLRREIIALEQDAQIIKCDFSDPEETSRIFSFASEFGEIVGLVNNASIFEPIGWEQTDLESWNRHLDINLTSPFLLSQAFARSLDQSMKGRIVNILDWKALRPADDHLPYTISKAALTALTKSLAVALAPRITVNGIALGAILPPSDGGTTDSLIGEVPAKRWAELEEVSQTLLFLLNGPEYITGEVIHLDGGRHLI
jgi:NAD(P)-dependent dehydrogenase (short-subunit alcohol dehydrogenase family)